MDAEEHGGEDLENTGGESGRSNVVVAVLVVLVLAAIAVAVLLLRADEPVPQDDPLQNIGTATENPVRETESVNPVEQANPFSGSYRNPFE